jgi:hypothetical protein
MNRPVGRRLALGATGLAACAMAVLAAMAAPLEAQGGRGQGPSPAGAAPIDLTGYWVAIVNEDGRWRMVAPPHGDYASIPLSQEGRRVADAWDPARDGRCEAFGAAGVMRMPTRLHITWEGEAVLRIDTDAGQQTRRVRFDPAATPSGPPDWQGHSVAEWLRPGGRGRGAGPAAAAGATSYVGSLRVVTTNLREGWLRRNGVPYSDATVLTEYFDRFPGPDGSEWLVVTTIVNDPKYLTREFVTSSHFRREPDGSGWRPSPCRAG